MSEPTTELLERVALRGRQLMLEGGWVTPDSCIAMSRLMCEVGRYFGWDIEARRAALAIFNHKYMGLWEQGKVKLDEALPQWAEDEGAWTVGIGTPRPDGSEGLHVVNVVHLEGTSYLVDASLDQASRPHKDINLEAGVFPFDHRSKLVFPTTTGVLAYELSRNDDYKKRSRDWYLFKERYGKVAAQLIREFK